jgi:hypothetical protein
LAESPRKATPHETLAALVTKARWDAVPFRRKFVQGGTLGHPVPGPLAEFVVHHDRSGFDTYCLIRLIGSAQPYAVQVSAQLFARALDIGSPGTVSKAVSRLIERKLVRRQTGRRSVVRVRREDGSGKRYTPAWSSREAYFQLPTSYWLAPEEWHRTLTLPEKAMLFVGLSLPDNFVLPYDRVPQWYGLSPSTAERGLVGLQKKGLLRGRTTFKPAPLAPRGYTEQITYSLLSPFSARDRKPAKPAEGRAQRKGAADHEA